MTSNFNTSPEVKISETNFACYSGWHDIVSELKSKISGSHITQNVIVVECYQGTNKNEIFAALQNGLNPALVIDSAEAMHTEERINEITFPDVTNDRIFGFITRLKMKDFFDHEKVSKIRSEAKACKQGTILIIGEGASWVYPEADLLIYADMARWEIQKRMRKNLVNNLGINNKSDSFESMYKRGYFVDWRVCDKVKKETIHKWNYVLDTNQENNPVMISGKTYLNAINQVVNQPFSVVPYFDAGPWGGQWMKEKFALDPALNNYAWCFNCVPEENSLYLKFGNTRFETPSVNLVFFKPVELLGDAVHARFGTEFPIRFDYLDTMQGGNLSLQVHPLTEYIQENFGIPYTQDESYYLLDTGDDACVYLGLKEDVDPQQMISELKNAEKDGVPFNDETYINKWPARKHDHFLIPGGTIHCSGKNSVVLEISATPYIFTFKLWDWGRLGMDGKPRPININHGIQNIQWDRTTSWVKQNLVNKIELIEKGDGFREERTGLHKREFIETRRHWFTKKVMHNTNEGVNVLTLIEGREIIVESPEGHFDPFVVHYAETFIVPAGVGAYSIRPFGESEGKECATIKAWVRVKG